MSDPIAEAYVAAPVETQTHRVWLETHLAGTTWRMMERREDGEAWIGRIRGQPIMVLWSIAVEVDSQPWLHVSASHRSRVPTWEEMCEVKRAFCGDRWAAQIHPPAEEYVNIGPRVLHLWSPWRDWPLPDFTHGLATI